MAGAKKLVIGASGFLGSHVTRQLVDRGDEVFYCVVDTRLWLRDPVPLFRTNVDGLLPGGRRAHALRLDTVVSSGRVRLMHIWPTLDHGKAERELTGSLSRSTTRSAGPRSSFGRTDAVGDSAAGEKNR